MTSRTPKKLAIGLVLPVVVATACVDTDLSDEGAGPKRNYALPTPPVLAPTHTDATTDYYAMSAKTGSRQIFDGQPPTPIEGENGMWPGPTIVARRGRPVVLTQSNELAHNIVIHNHGHKSRPEDDGHPVDYLLPGATRDYHYPNDQRAATYWLHDHTMGQTGIDVFRGLASLYIIKDDDWDRLNLPTGKFDVPLVIQDRRFNGDGTLRYVDPPFGQVNVVNGVRTPRMAVSRRRYLFRVLNASDHRPYRLYMNVLDSEKGSATTIAPKEVYKVVASDAGLLPHSVPTELLLVAPAERFAFVHDFSKYPIGTSIILRNNFFIPVPGVPPLEEVMRFDVVGDEPDDSTPPPDDLLPIERLDPNAPDVVHRVVEFGANETGASATLFHWYMNGLPFDPARIDFEAKLGTTEVWDIKNPTFADHSLHLHEIAFQILDTSYGAPPPVLQGWKDTVFVPANSSAKIILKWEGFPGTYVFHCHMLFHEDVAMMAQVRVSE